MASSTLRRAWEPIIDAARTIVLSYAYEITLRQLHYRLVMTAGLGYANTVGDYHRLSALTAEGRRDGSFPALLDQTRETHRANSWENPADALTSIRYWYRRDRTDGQTNLLVLAGEKATLLAQLEAWFDDLGLPIVLLRGYGSQTYVDDVRSMVDRDGRDPVLIYAGDFDPSGEDILRDFLDRCDVFDPANVKRIAVREPQITPLGLVVNEGKPEDSRAVRFVDRYPALHAAHGLGDAKMVRVKGGMMRPTPVQIEVEAIDPNVLQALYQAAIDLYWDTSAYDAVVQAEVADLALLREVQSAVESGKLYLDPDGKLRKRR